MAARSYAKNEGYLAWQDLRRQERKLQSLLRLCEDQANDPSLQEAVCLTEQDIHRWHDNKAEAIKIKSRADWFEMGERMTKYFFNLYRNRESGTPLTELHDQDRILTEDEDIIKHVHQFYTSLYTPAPPNLAVIAELLDNDFSQLDRKTGAGLVEEVTAEELWKLIQQSPKNKAPGPDSLSYEFYITFFAELGPLMAKVLTEALQNELIPPSFCKFTVVLLHKKGRSSTDLGN